MDDPRPTSDEGGTDDPGTPMDPQVQGQLPTAGAAHASHDMAGVAGAQAEGRATSELAADVRAALHTLTAASFMEADVAAMHEDSLNGYASLDALVARVTDLEAQAERAMEAAEAALAKLDEACDRWAADKERAAAAEAQVAALEQKNEEANRAWSRAEAQVAALTQERNDWREKAGGWRAIAEDKDGNLFCARAEAAEAALATTRQALAEIAANETWVQAGPLIDLARRALAATEEQT